MLDLFLAEHAARSVPDRVGVAIADPFLAAAFALASEQICVLPCTLLQAYLHFASANMAHGAAERRRKLQIT